MATLHGATVTTRRYDHNLRNAVCATADPHLFDDIPVGTQRTWIRRGSVQVISLGPDTSQLLARVQRLERANRTLRNVIRLLLALIRAFGVTLGATRVPSTHGKLLNPCLPS